MNREFLMLAHQYNTKKHDIKGWFFSEKLDGIRGFWDGGISRGLYKSEIPWANNDKDERFVYSPRATGLWTRYGNVLHAPEWFLDQLPPYPLDGELFTDRKSWQSLSKIIKKLVPDDAAWRLVTYNVFDSPTYVAFVQTGQINNPNFTKFIDGVECMAWIRSRTKVNPSFRDFRVTTNALQGLFKSHPIIKPMVQHELNSLEQVDALFRNILELGGEGLIGRNPKSYWEAKRSHQQIKIKVTNDAEATVVGYIWGRETDRGSKLLGKMGALICDFNGKRFELSGFTDEERRMNCLVSSAAGEGTVREGQEVSNSWESAYFPKGIRVTFRYRELSDTGVPKEGRFYRKHPGA